FPSSNTCMVWTAGAKENTFTTDQDPDCQRYNKLPMGTNRQGPFASPNVAIARVSLGMKGVWIAVQMEPFQRANPCVGCPPALVTRRVVAESTQGMLPPAYRFVPAPPPASKVASAFTRPP